MFSVIFYAILIMGLIIEQKLTNQKSYPDS